MERFGSSAVYQLYFMGLWLETTQVCTIRARILAMAGTGFKAVVFSRCGNADFKGAGHGTLQPEISNLCHQLDWPAFLISFVLRNPLRNAG